MKRRLRDMSSLRLISLVIMKICSENFTMDEARTEDIPQVSIEENDFLTATYIEEEFRKTVFLMEHNKALGPDGFSSRVLSNFLGYH
jgi:hypothetical protein